MILKYGMDAEMGPVYYMDKGDDTMNNHFRRYSDTTTQMADDKIKKLLSDSYAKAKSILTDNRAKIEKIVAVLLEKT
jgi:ATP-dependent Zn protease